MNFKKCIFHTPDGKTLFINDISHLKADMIVDFKNYWTPGSGDGLIEYFDDSGNNTSSLIIETNVEYIFIISTIFLLRTYYLFMMKQNYRL